MKPSFFFYRFRKLSNKFHDFLKISRPFPRFNRIIPVHKKNNFKENIVNVKKIFRNNFFRDFSGFEQLVFFNNRARESKFIGKRSKSRK